MIELKGRDPAPPPEDGPQPEPRPLGDTDPNGPWRPPDRCRYVGPLHEVIDPELGVNIIDLGLVYGLRVADGTARLRMTLTTPGCPLSAYFDDEVRARLRGAPGVDDTEVEIVWEPPWSPDMMSDAAKAQLGWRR